VLMGTGLFIGCSLSLGSVYYLSREM
jgi:hypothetical protein